MKRWVYVGLSAVLSVGAAIVVVQKWLDLPSVKDGGAVEVRLPARTHAKQSEVKQAPMSSADTAALRAQYNKSGESYTKHLGELTVDCWDKEVQPKSYKGEAVVNLAILIPTTLDKETEFDFCIEALRLGAHRVIWGDKGLVDPEENAALGLDGYWFAFSDGHTRWATADGGPGFTAAVQREGSVCLKGTAPRVMDGKYDKYWGAGIALRLSRAGDEARFYRPKFDDIEVFMSGKAVPKLLRLALDDEAKGIGTGRHWCSDIGAG